MFNISSLSLVSALTLCAAGCASSAEPNENATPVPALSQDGDIGIQRIRTSSCNANPNPPGVYDCQTWTTPGGDHCVAISYTNGNWVRSCDSGTTYGSYAVVSVDPPPDLGWKF